MIDIKAIDFILNNGTDEDVEELLTPDDCLRHMAHEMGVPIDELRRKYRKIKEGLPIEK